jgi:hypothetical protein
LDKEIRKYHLRFLKGVDHKGRIRLDHNAGVDLPLAELPVHGHEYHDGELGAINVYVEDEAGNFSSHSLEDILAEIWSMLGGSPPVEDYVLDEAGNTVVDESFNMVTYEVA